MILDSRNIYSIIAIVFLILGTFAPLMNAPIVGSINYISNGRGDGIIIISLCFISLILVLLKRYKYLTYIGLITFVQITYLFYHIQTKIEGLSKTNVPILGNMSKVISIQWGWVPLILGSLMLSIQSIIKFNTNENSNLVITNQIIDINDKSFDSQTPVDKMNNVSNNRIETNDEIVETLPNKYVEIAKSIVVFTIVFFVGIWIVNKFESNTNVNIAENPSKTVENKMNLADSYIKLYTYNINALDKDYRRDSIPYSAHIRFSLQYYNVSGHAISGVQSKIEFLDSFNDVLHTIDVKDECAINPGEIGSSSMYWYFEENPFITNDPYDKLLTAVISKTIKIKFNATKISFANGNIIKFD